MHNLSSPSLVMKPGVGDELWQWHNSEFMPGRQTRVLDKQSLMPEFSSRFGEIFEEPPDLQSLI